MAERRRRRPRRLRARDAGGGAAIWSVLWLIVFLMLGGVAVDVTNAHRARAQLQAAADAAALAAAAQLPDEAAGRETALTLAQMNLGAEAGAIREEAIEFGAWDPAAGGFVPGGTPVTAARVTAVRAEALGNPVSAFLLPLIGFDGWDVATRSVARQRGGTAPPPEPSCPGATILTTDYLGLGGNNTFLDGVCLHGETGVHAGGNDFFDPDVRVTAANESAIYIGHVRSGSATRDEVAAEQSREAVVVPQLQARFDELWNGLWPGSSATYAGPLVPDFVKRPDGTVRVVRRNSGWWTMQPSDVQPNTVYLVNHGMQMAGNVQLRNAMVLARGQIGIGGGPSLQFSDVVLFGTGQLNFSGNVMWGRPADYCDEGRYGVYILSLDRVSLGGWGPTAGIHGAVVAAPNVSTGGSLKNSGGLWIESTQRMQIGGNSRVEGCGAPLEDWMDFGVGAPPAADEDAAPVVAGSMLVR